MKKVLFSTAAALLMAMPTVFAQGPECIPGDILVMLAPGQTTEHLEQDLAVVNGKETNLKVVKEVSAPMRVWLLHFEQPELPQQLMLRAVQREPAVMIAQNNHVVTDRVVPNDTQYAAQWHHQNIDSEGAWDTTTGGVTATGDTIVVCIIENSNLPHSDLVANAWYNFLEIPNNGIDDDANGYVDDFLGWNPADNDDDVYGGGHGTQVAGMIGATGNNSMGVAGANWDVKMMVVTRDGISEAAVIESYTYPLVQRRLYNSTGGTKGAFVVATNASWGINFGQPSDAPLWCAFYDTLGTAGVLNCGATANLDIDIDVDGDLPTACPSDFMVSVTATNDADIRTFSAYGSTHVDLGAPGEDVLTTNIGGGYGSTSGTSFASPLTAGVIGLLYSVPCSNMMALVQSDPAAGALYVRDALFAGVEQVGNLPGQTLTGGRVNSNNSVQHILDNCGACPGATNLNAVNTGIDAASLVWSSGGALFNLQYRPVGTATWTAVNGLTTMNYAATGLMACTDYEFQVEVDCDTITSGFSGSFTWMSEGCCTTPDLLAGVVTSETTADVSWSPVLAATEYSVQYAVAGTGQWTLVTGLLAPATTLTGLLPCTAYEVQVTSDCNGVNSPWSASVFFNTPGCGACTDNIYCQSIADDATEEWIANVSLNTLNSMSSSDAGYGDFTTLSTDLVMGTPYTITLTPGYDGFNYDEYFAVWIDLDQDGDFTDAGELVYTSGATTTAVMGTITVPTSATIGGTRMRVIMRFDELATGPCDDGYDFGETEDYCVNIMDTNVGIQSPGASVNTVNMYPDPADRDVFFDIIGATGNDPVVISILDNSGKTVVRKSTTTNKATLTTAWLANGLYFYRAEQGGKELGRGKLVISHYQ